MASFIISNSATCSFYILGTTTTTRRIIRYVFILLFITQVIMVKQGIDLILFFSCCFHRVAFRLKCNTDLALLRISSVTREYPDHASLPHTNRRYSELKHPRNGWHRQCAAFAGELDPPPHCSYFGCVILGLESFSITLIYTAACFHLFFFFRSFSLFALTFFREKI